MVKRMVIFIVLACVAAAGWGGVANADEPDKAAKAAAADEA